MSKGLDVAYAIRKKTAKKMNSGGIVPVPRKEDDEMSSKDRMAAVAEQARNGGSTDTRSAWQKLKDSVDPKKAHRYADGGEIPVDNTDPGGMNNSPNVPSLPSVTPAYNKEKGGGGGGGGGDMMGSIMKMAPMIAAMASDENGKENIEGADEDMDEFLSSLDPESYDYKNPDAPGADSGRQYGVMAQDLEKSKAGKSVVDDTPHGKMVDSTHALGLTMGGLGRLVGRVKKLESLKKFAVGGEVPVAGANQAVSMGELDDPMEDPETKRKKALSKAFSAVTMRQTGRP